MTRNALSKKVIHIIIVVFFCSRATAFAGEGHWPDFALPYSNRVNVYLNQPAVVSVDLPARYLQEHESVIFNIDIESQFTYMIDGLKQMGFQGFTPKMSVNGAMVFGNYIIPVNALPKRQQAKVRIKSRYLRPGKNELRFYTGKEGSVRYRCKGGKFCIVYVLHQLWFENASQYATPVRPLRQPTDAMAGSPESSGNPVSDNMIVTFNKDSQLNEWEIGEQRDGRLGKQGFSRVFTDMGEGVVQSRGCLALDFKLGTAPMPGTEIRSLSARITWLNNRNLTDYHGMEFYTKGSREWIVTLQFTDRQRNHSRGEHWFCHVPVSTQWKRTRIYFNMLQLKLRRAQALGTDRVFDPGHISKIEWIVHDHFVKRGQKGTLWLDEVRFFRYPE